MRVDHCLRCHSREVATNRFGLCRDCQLKWTQPDAEANYRDFLMRCKVDAWNNAPRFRRFLFRFLQTLAVISAITATECAYWLLEPTFYRMGRHPLVTFAFIVIAVIAPLSWFKARNIKREITDRVTADDPISNRT